ncbi:hypothetical protein ACFLU6_10950 [Acidobacteriota bacterium]
MKLRPIIIAFSLMLSFLVADPLISPAAAQDQDVDSILQKLTQRLETYAEYDSYTASAVATVKRMDKNWNPKKVEVVKKEILHSEDDHQEKIIEACRTEDDVTTDITEEMRKKQEKMRKKTEKKKKKQEEKKDEEEEDDDDDDDDKAGRRTMRLGKDELFPFDDKSRQNYAFTRLEDTEIDGRPVYAIRSEARQKSKKLYEGTYYIDKDTFDAVMVELSPSKNPKFFKQFDFKMTFIVLPGDYFVIKTYWMRLHVNAIIKKVRIEVEEHYDDYRVKAG